MQALYLVLKRFASSNQEKLFDIFKYLVSTWIFSNIMIEMVMYACSGSLKPCAAVMKVINSLKTCSIWKPLEPQKALNFWSLLLLMHYICILERNRIPAVSATNILTISFYLVQRIQISFLLPDNTFHLAWFLDSVL